ncbi:TolC family protein [Mucilaginibacter endophyticus]|uniref:TolC family protein n=1 Tax=Mucilaginibacter endophyticus TaxID=2675003 RepID=UPI000E0D4F52|nr:TolC family protein [Mucilaginibacter endophyticus]
MNALRSISLIRWILMTSTSFFFGMQNPSYAQQNVPSAQIRPMSLQQAIALGKTENNLVKAAASEEAAASEDLKDTKMNAFPTILANSDYQRFTKLTLFESGLGSAHSIPKRPTQYGADAGLSAIFNIYSGGKQRAAEQEQQHRKDLAGTSKLEQSAAIGLRVVNQYLDMVRLRDQRRLIIDQVKRAETRYRNITAFFNNQKVTRSDLLRAELNLSAVKLNLEQIENDLTISNQKLNVLINFPGYVKIEPTDSANMVRPQAAELSSLAATAPANSFLARKAAQNLRFQAARVEALRSSNRPSISLFSAYGLTYPNAIFYPPVDQAYAIGFIGVKVQYNISSLYQNKNKVSAGRIRYQELEYLQQNVNDDVMQETASLVIKYQEELNRIIVAEQSIEQAQINYRIINAKYLNQLALLTDLLDADNLLQEARYNIVLAQTNAQLIYYRMLYVSGKL